MKDLLFFLQLFKPYKYWLLTGFLLSLITALASISLLTLSGWFITSAAIAGVLAPDGIAFTFNFLQPAAEIRALAITRTFGRYTERLITHEATFRVLAEIRCWFFAKLIPLAPGRLSMRRSAELLTGITQDIDALDALYLRLMVPFLVAIIGGGAVIFFIAMYSIHMALVVLTWLLVGVFVIPRIFHRSSRSTAKKVVELAAEFKVRQIEMIQGMADLLAFNAYQSYQNQISKVSDQMIETQRKNNHLSALSTTIINFLSHMVILIVLVMGSILFQQGSISGAELVMLAFSVLALFEIVLSLSSSSQLLAKTQAAAKRIRKISQLSPVITEPVHACSVPTNGDLIVSHLSFRYPEQSDWVFNNINLHIPQGSKIAIIGQSGAGKSTLLQLILRFFDPQQGRIEYRGVDYKHFASEQLMEQFSVLSQQTQIFAATVKENLLIAQPAATNRDINLAINKAGLTQFVRQLPDGINTWVGENGAQVSGGEARRIALARVYLKNAPIILLDEPTEGLDYKTETEVLNALQQIAEQKTMIMVTHRQAGLKWVDSIYQIDKGQLNELQLSYA